MLTWIVEPSEQYNSNQKVSIKWDGNRLCHLQTWGFRSCAVHNLEGFDKYLFNSSKKLTAEMFFNFIIEQSQKLSYQPKTMYFLLSSSQVNEPGLKRLINYPKVKLVDKFANQAHGPNHVFLYRYSDAEDFL